MIMDFLILNDTTMLQKKEEKNDALTCGYGGYDGEMDFVDIGEEGWYNVGIC